MLHTVFKEKDWQVIIALPALNDIKELFYSRHDCEVPGDRAWMDTWQRKCRDCGEIVPDNIQTILTLLTWDKQW